jgi:hypothetical protein
MPLKEAAGVIEQYFKQHHYDVAVGGRGGVNLYAVQAAYAVATTFGWEDEEETARRRNRMVRVLRFYKYRLSQMHPTDVQVVEEAIEAILNDRRDYQADFPDTSTNEARVENAEDDASAYENVVLNTGIQAPQEASPPLDEQTIQRMIQTALQQHDTDQGSMSLTQTEAMSVKHGYEMLDMKFSTQVASMNKQVEVVEKAIDRYLGGQQIKTGNKQVSAAWWGRRHRCGVWCCRCHFWYLSADGVTS